MKLKVLFVSLMLSTCLISKADDYLRGDVDLDGKVGISDVADLIDYLLSGVWTSDTVSSQYQTFTVNGVSFNMVYVQGGTFSMGATSEQGDEAYDDEFPIHQVTLSDFSIGQTELTQELWEAVMMGENPSQYKGLLSRPVDHLTWDDCQEFISRLNEITGKNFRLPTEAEWEYAARGGKYSKGYKYSGSNNLDDVAWYSDNSYNVTYPVALKLPNELGLYDMSGNVFEWCYDWYGYYSQEDQVNPTGPEAGPYHVIRGGYYGIRLNCRVSHRSDARYWDNWFGLRLVL